MIKNNKNDIRTGKNKLLPDKKTHVVYNLKCKDCNVSYVVQTKSIWKQEFKSMNNIDNPENYSVVSNHVFILRIVIILTEKR